MESYPFPPVIGAEQAGLARVAVIGAGSMGSGIAAQFANAGIAVDLLDMPGGAGKPRNASAEAGISRQLKAGGFMHPARAALISPGNIVDDLGRLAKADWIVEAIIEDLAAKRDLYRRIEAVMKPSAIISSNTSTIPLAELVQGASEAFARAFLITHFFNPPRVMPLVEIVAAATVDAAILARARLACHSVLGKTIVDCKDTPGFIANRIGCHWLAVAALEAKQRGLSVEQADQVMSAFGIPKTGVFGLLDLVGIDLIPLVWGSLMRVLPAKDDLHRVNLPEDPLVKDMLAMGRFGRKAEAGFYRRTADKRREALDLATGAYRPEAPPAKLPGEGRNLVALIDDGGVLGAYAWAVLSRVVVYAAQCGAEIADDIAAIDHAMTLGYAWREGPFRLADRYGAARIAARLEKEARSLPALLAQAASNGGFYAKGAPLCSAGTRRAAPLAAPALAVAARIAGNASASLKALGEGVAAFEVHTKMNALAPEVFDLLEETLPRAGRDFRALVIANDNARAFSVGADLAAFASLVKAEDWASLEAYVARGQKLFLALKRAPFPVVAAAHGLALGGGCEFMLHADAIIAHGELAAGLPEVKVGLVPGWGGCTQLLLRRQMAGGIKGPGAVATAVFETIFSGRASESALDAAAMGLLRPCDAIVMHREQLLPSAKAKALALLEKGYVPPAPAALTLCGPSGRLAIMATIRASAAAGRLSPTDLALAEGLAKVLSGGNDADPLLPMAEEAVMALEFAALGELARRQTTLQRIEHMLTTGKPLHN